VESLPLAAVGEETDISEIAQLLAAHRVKRAPVIRDERVVGIVSRADLLRALVAERDVVVLPPSGFLANAFAERDVHFHDRCRPTETHPLSPHDQPDEEDLSASGFQGLLSDFEHKKHEKIEATRLAGVEQRRQRVAAMDDQHVFDENWRILLHKARDAAELRFPSELCSDGGRAINVNEADWPSTLRAENLSPMGARPETARLPPGGERGRFPGRHAGRYRLVPQLGRVGGGQRRIAPSLTPERQSPARPVPARA
jgi:hypothetical protein